MLHVVHVNSIVSYFVLPFRAFENPASYMPDEIIQDSRDALACGILEQLKSRSVLPTIIPFRHDVFRYFFGGKGEKKQLLFCRVR